MASPLMHVRWSAIKTWRQCHKLYDYRYNQHLERRKPAVPLIRGSILGLCLDEIVEKKPYEPVLAEYEKKYGKLFKEEQEMYGDLIGECRRIVQKYEQIYKNDGLTYLKGKNGERHEIEVETRFTIDGTRVKFTGHLDKLPQDKQGRIFVMDHKSHKTIPDEIARYNDLQLVTYLWLLPQSDFPEASGVLWDYLRTKPPAIPETLKAGGLTKRANIDTDFDTYMGAIKANNLDPADYSEILGKLKSEGHARYFQRVQLPKPPKALIENVVADFKSTILEMRDCSRRNEFTRNMTKDCGHCGMYSLCQAELRGLDISFIVKSEYQESDYR